MPSFLNKVFGYKKHDDKELARPARDAPDHTTLLDGKYEAIPHILFPSIPSSPDTQPTKHPDRDLGFSLFKPKSRKSAHKCSPVVPHLTLRLGPKENLGYRALGGVFDADPESQSVLDDAVIAEKRLNPSEALSLIRACAQAITERGLETLGIMHPHWFSASPDVQRKLISLFIRSLTPQSRTAALSPTSPSPTSAFENELHFTRSPHDVAAVLRWGLRHLTLENDHFGREAAEWAWYSTFFHAERNASYPPKAFSELLLPQLPASHLELLTATLNLISSLASHAETNSISGSKLSKFLGIWLFVATRAEESDDWSRFYARWERAGRILEHLFLARLREESLALRLPTRLQELVKYYPYNKGSPTTEDDLLSRPRFSTRQYDALCVRVETVLTHDGKQPKQHPIQLLLDAFQLPIENPSGDEPIASWNTLKAMVFEEATSPEGPQFARIFVDETIQLLSLILADNTVSSPILLTSPTTNVVSRRRSSSLSKVFERPLSMSNYGSTPASPMLASSPVIADWTQFSLSGFGEAPSTQPLVPLLNQDDDTEVTQPRISRKSSRQRGKSRSRRQHSEEREPSDALPSSRLEPEQSILATKLASVHVVQIDEAFIDFWSDAIVDTVSANWPVFVLCGLKEIPSVEQPIRWLVIEQTYRRQSQPTRNPSPDGRRGRSPRPSFKSDISGFRINTMFSSARRRFSVFNKSATDLDARKTGGKSSITGELGEVVVEEEPTTFLPASPTKANKRAHVDAGAAVNRGVMANIADQLKVNDIYTTPIAGTPPIGLLKVTSVEPTPQSGGYDASADLPRSSVEKGSLQSVNRKADIAADPLTDAVAVAGNGADAQTSDRMALAPRSTAENSVVEDGQIPVAQPREGSVIGTETRPVGLVAPPADGSNGDQHLPSGGPSNVVQIEVPSDAEAVQTSVAMPSVPESTVDPRSADEEPRVPSQKAPADMATSAAESVGQSEIDNLALAHVQYKVISTEASAQLQPDCPVARIEDIKGVAELAEMATPASERLEETSGLDSDIDAYGPPGTAQAPFEGVASRSVVAQLQATLEAPSIEIVPSTQVVPGHISEQPSGLAGEDAQCLAEASVVGVLPVDVPAGTASAMQASVDVTRAEAESRVASESFVFATRDEGVPTPALENAVLDETPGPETATEEHKPVEAAASVVQAAAPAEGIAGPAPISEDAEAREIAPVEYADVIAVPVEDVVKEVDVPVTDAASGPGDDAPSVPLSVDQVVRPAVGTADVEHQALVELVPASAEEIEISVPAPEETLSEKLSSDVVGASEEVDVLTAVPTVEVEEASSVAGPLAGSTSC